ncbi:transcriptional adaptor 2 ada2 -related [Anaeramoeba flamelloides]|uniref:Transcriptional adaptor 2 ada2 -related n=1 Tax=Anaeramoeba flamelloides TaxID=1746091 RepID=A0AAV8A0V4_9EUKA|nr:transcriptional adaptor 2 ada2 -related [Anaeramoeba flamelloides]
MYKILFLKIGNHKKSHSYHIFAPPKHSIYEKKWNLNDELCILNQLEKKGFCNWEAVSEELKTKTKEECKSHYHQTYLKAPIFSRPEPIGEKKKQTLVLGKNGRLVLKQDDNGFSDLGQILPSTPRQRKRKNNRTKFSKPRDSPYSGKRIRGLISFGDCAGYMEKRQGFEIEYDEHAEDITKDMGFTEGNLQIEQLENQILQGTMERAGERERRTKTIVKLGLMYPRSITEKSKKKQFVTRKRKAFDLTMRHFTRCFDNKKQIENVSDSLFDEYKIKSEIIKLLEFRQMGVKSLSEGEKHLKMKKKIFKKERRTKRRANSRRKTLPVKQTPTRTPRKAKNAQTINNPNTFEKNCSLLSEGEVNICNKINLESSQYLKIKKQTILNDKSNVINPLLSKEHLELINNYFEKNNWL